MTYEELETELKRTQAALADTQKGVLQIAEHFGRLMAILKNSMIVDDLDKSFIEGKITEKEYIKKYKKQHEISNLFSTIFAGMGTQSSTQESEKSEDKNE